jgi:hypothetical protein
MFCVLHKVLNVISVMQVERPSYRLILKKEKAHVMDINCVRWCPQVTSENSQQNSLCLAGGYCLRIRNKIVFDLFS